MAHGVGWQGFTLACLMVRVTVYGIKNGEGGTLFCYLLFSNRYAGPRNTLHLGVHGWVCVRELEDNYIVLWLLLCLQSCSTTCNWLTKFAVRLYPVLKHGPRSLTVWRVFWWQTIMRNESERKAGGLISSSTSVRWKIFLKPVRQIHMVRTRKMTNFTCFGWSPVKTGWRSDIVLTCKSLVESE